MFSLSKSRLPIFQRELENGSVKRIPGGTVVSSAGFRISDSIQLSCVLNLLCALRICIAVGDVSKADRGAAASVGSP